MMGDGVGKRIIKSQEGPINFAKTLGLYSENDGEPLKV